MPEYKVGKKIRKQESKITYHYFISPLNSQELSVEMSFPSPGLTAHDTNEGYNRA